MNCPACLSSLTPVPVGGITVDVCIGGCAGTWFDQFELKKVDEPSEQALDEILQMPSHQAVTRPRDQKLCCPKCESVKLMRRFFSAKKQIEIDECPNCGGHWLDAGEWKRVREETGRTQSETPKKGTIDLAAIGYLYRLRLAEREARGESTEPGVSLVD